MLTPTLIKNFIAGAAIAAARIVKLGAADGTVVQGAAVGDSLLGVCVQPGGAGNGERVDVALGGIAEVEAGGAITRGDWLTSDAAGKALSAAPAAGTNNNVIGRAMASAANGDLIPVLLAPGRIQG
jgi:hypothetical protein